MIVTTFIFHPVPIFSEYKIISLKYIPYSEILFILITLLWFIYIDFETIKNKLLNDKISFVFLMFFLIFLFGFLWSEDLSNAIIIFKTIMYFLLVPILITTYEKRYIKYMLFILLFLCVLSSTATIILYLSSYAEGFELKLSGISPFINHMYYGTILSLSLSYFLININLKEKKLYFIVKLISILIILTAISLICNRSSLIGLFVAISFYIYIDKNSLTKLKRFLLILTSLFLITIFVSKINSSCGIKFLDTQNNIIEETKGKRGGTSLGCRLGYIESSIDLIKNSSLIGVGTGDSISAMQKYYGEEEYKELVTKPCLLGHHNQIFYFDNHNMYLTMLMLFGPLGLIFFLYFFYSIFKEGTKVLSWELRLSVIIVSLASIPITLFFTSSNFVLFFSLYIGIIYIYYKDKLENEDC